MFAAASDDDNTSLNDLLLDGDWACDDNDRKSASGGYLMAGGRRCRTTGQHALNSGESETMSMSELSKEDKQTRDNLEFCGVGLSANHLAHRCHRRSVGRMKTSGRQALLVARGTEERKLQCEAS